jgi:hypothetical protein
MAALLHYYHRCLLICLQDRADTASKQSANEEHSQLFFLIGGLELCERECLTVLHACQIIRRLEGLVENELAPSDDADLVFLTRLLQLAAGCRSMLRSRKYSFPAADPELLHTFYPVLTSCILEVQLRDEDDTCGMFSAVVQMQEAGSATACKVHMHMHKKPTAGFLPTTLWLSLCGSVCAPCTYCKDVIGTTMAVLA